MRFAKANWTVRYTTDTHTWVQGSYAQEADARTNATLAEQCAEQCRSLGMAHSLVSAQAIPANEDIGDTRIVFDDSQDGGQAS